MKFDGKSFFIILLTIRKFDFSPTFLNILDILLNNYRKAVKSCINVLHTCTWGELCLRLFIQVLVSIL